MNLLLLLSALLSALAGIGGGVRAPDAVQAVAGAAATQTAAAQTKRAVTTRPVTPLPSIGALADVRQILLPPPIVAAVPLWASRRRE